MGWPHVKIGHELLTWPLVFRAGGFPFLLLCESRRYDDDDDDDVRLLLFDSTESTQLDHDVVTVTKCFF